MADFFISYSRKDSDFADHLYTALISRKLTAWMDRENLEGGDRFTQEIDKHITSCRAVLVVLSPNSVVSDWVENEVLFALKMNKPVIPLDIQDHDPLVWLTNRQTIDFTKPALFDKAVDSVLLAFNSGNVQEHRPNTPVAPFTSQLIYQAGLEAQHKGDLELALAQWNQIIARDPRYLNGELASEVKVLEDQVRPQRISRIESQAQKVFQARQWTEMLSLLNGLYELDPQGTCTFAIDLLVVSANTCYYAGDWEAEIACWEHVLQWDATYPHAKERQEVANTNKKLRPRYDSAQNWVNESNTLLAQQELQALWKSAPYYGDPAAIARPLGLTVPMNIIDVLTQTDQTETRVQQKQTEWNMALSQKRQRDQEIATWYSQEEEKHLVKQENAIANIARFFLGGDIGFTVLMIVYIVQPRPIDFIYPGCLIGLLALVNLILIPIVISLKRVNIFQKWTPWIAIGETFAVCVWPILFIVQGVFCYFVMGFINHTTRTDYILPYLILPSLIWSVFLAIFILIILVRVNERVIDLVIRNSKKSATQGIQQKEKLKQQASEHQYQQQLADIQRRFADV